MEPLISVIVPIYKVEEYLRECIDSVCNQTYQNLQIILVDDGSPDKCGDICNEFKKKDNRITVIHKENGGLSDARNAGLLIAEGDYYYFVDSDDRLPANSVERMLTIATDNKAQMVIGGFERFSNTDGNVFFSTDSDGVYCKKMNKSEAMTDFFRDGCQAWAVLYKKEVHQGIFFPKGEINEDEAIVFQLLDRCDTVVVTNEVVYSYRNREESITTTEFSEKKLVWIKHCKDNYLWLNKKHPEIAPLAYKRYGGSLVWALSNMTIAPQRFKSSITKCKTDLAEFMKNSNWQFGLSSKDKIRIYILLYFYRPYALIVKLLGKKYT